MRKFVLFLLLIGLSGCMRSTGPTEVGVLVRKFALTGKKGVQDEVYAPGSTYFVMPLVTDWYTFDTKIQNLEMTADESRGDRAAPDEVRFKTIDGNDIGLDAIISWRIIPEKVPFILENVAYDDNTLKDNLVRPIARSITRDVFGELKTEEFYISEEREKKAMSAATKLNQVLNPFGVMVERVSTKDYRFNPEYQKAIEDKKIADQTFEKFRSEQHAVTEEYNTKLEQTKGQVLQVKERADGEFDKAKLAADTYYQQQLKMALAIRAEGEAVAKGISEMNKAMAGSGGDTMVKLKIAEALANKQIVLLPSASGIDFKTTNLNDLLQTYGVKSLAEQAGQSQQPEQSE